MWKSATENGQNVEDCILCECCRVGCGDAEIVVDTVLCPGDDAGLVGG